MIIAAHESLAVAKVNNFVNASLRCMSLHHPFFQNFICLPLPILKPVLLLKIFLSFVVAFDTPNAYRSLTSLEHLPPSSYPYFLVTSTFKGIPFKLQFLAPFVEKSLVKLGQNFRTQTGSSYPCKLSTNSLYIASFQEPPPAKENSLKKIPFISFPMLSSSFSG